MNKLYEMTGEVYLGDWSFKVISLSDKALYKEYIMKTAYPANLWSSNFDFLWAVSQSKVRKVLYKIVDNMLVTFGCLRNKALYLICLPFGEGGPEKVFQVIYKCMTYCMNWNKDKDPGTVIKVVNSQQLNFLRQCPEFDKHFKVTGLVGMEKHFSVQKLVSLSGKDFDTIRRKINKFKRLCPNVVVRDYKDADFNAVMKLGEYWSNTSGQKYSYIFDNVYFYEIIKHCKELNHMVLVVENNGEIIGLVSGGELPTGQSWWCLSKFMNDYDGLSEFLVVELSKAIHKINPEIELMNAAEDLGPGGLRFFKERFRPVLDLRRFVISLKS